MDEEKLRQIIREEMAKAQAGHASIWPLMALVERWRVIATGIRQKDPQQTDKARMSAADTYVLAAKDLEEWIRAGTLKPGP